MPANFQCVLSVDKRADGPPTLPRGSGARNVAIGTTVVRALEHAALRDGHVHAGRGVATQRIGAASPLRVVDALLTVRTSRVPAITNCCARSQATSS